MLGSFRYRDYELVISSYCFYANSGKIDLLCLYSDIIKTVAMISNDRGLIMRLMLLLIITALRFIASEEESPVSIVNRRLHGDTFHYFNSSLIFCSHSDNLTLLVGNGRCVNNQDLFNGNQCRA